MTAIRTRSDHAGEHAGPGTPDTKEGVRLRRRTVDATRPTRDPTPAAGDVEQLEVADPLRQRRVDDEVLALGSRPSIVRSSSSGAPVDQACGLHAVGY